MQGTVFTLARIYGGLAKHWEGLEWVSGEDVPIDNRESKVKEELDVGDVVPENILFCEAVEERRLLILVI